MSLNRPDNEVCAPFPLDVVGDLHGQLGALESLARQLGYEVDGDWTHPEGRRLVFLGDLVDRGPHSLEVAERVRHLCEGGTALCLMGNHEFNLLEWRHGRSGPKTSNRPTIEDVKARPARWAPVLDFFETLPVSLQLPDLRVIHAVWHRRCVAALEPVLRVPGPDGVDRGVWSTLIHLHSPYHMGRKRPGVPDGPFEDQDEGAVEILLKGYEIRAEAPFRDNDGKLREFVRSEWWNEDGHNVPLDRRIVFGHYWNLPPVPGHHDAFVPPYPSGRPELRAWFERLLPALTASGVRRVPERVRAVCVDFNGVIRGGGAACAAAYRHPEAEVVWASEPTPTLIR